MTTEEKREQENMKIRRLEQKIDELIEINEEQRQIQEKTFKILYKTVEKVEKKYKESRNLAIKGLKIGVIILIGLLYMN